MKNQKQQRLIPQKEILEMIDYYLVNHKDEYPSPVLALKYSIINYNIPQTKTEPSSPKED